MKSLIRVLAGTCGILLLVTAYYHSTGYDEVKSIIASADVSGFFAEAIPAQWLLFSWHLAVLSIPLIWSALRFPTWFLPASIFCFIVSVGNFLWVYLVAGWFPGTIILFAVALVLLFVSVALYRSRNASAT